MIASIDAVLRGEGRHAVGRGRVPVLELVIVLATSGILYGLVMGGFSLRLFQSVFSGLKVPLLLLASTLICLPSFFVLNAILGLRDDFAAAARAILAAQATVAIVLLALAPTIIVFYVSSDSYRSAVFVNGVVFAVATLGGQQTLGRHYAPLVRSNRLHRIGKWSWVFLYVFVAIQLAWVLRPFVGDPSMAPRFLRENAWSNAYVVVLRDVLGIGG